MTKFFLPLAASAAIALALTSCGGGSTDAAKSDASGDKATDKHYTSVSELTDVDLSSYGYPLVIKAPKGAKVMKDTVMKTLAIDGGKYFKCSVSQSSGAEADGMGASFAFKLAHAANEDSTIAPHFSKYLVDKPDQMLVESKPGNSNTFIVTVNAKKAPAYFTFHDGIAYDLNEDQNTDFTPADVKTMFEAATQAKAK